MSWLGLNVSLFLFRSSKTINIDVCDVAQTEARLRREKFWASAAVEPGEDRTFWRRLTSRLFLNQDIEIRRVLGTRAQLGGGGSAHWWIASRDGFDRGVGRQRRCAQDFDKSGEGWAVADGNALLKKRNSSTPGRGRR